MNVDFNFIEDNDASSFELHEDDRYADVCEPLYLQPKAVDITVSQKNTRRKESSPPLQNKRSEARNNSGQRRRLPKKKRIRFGRDRDGQILCQYYSNPESLSEEEIGLCWFNEDIEHIEDKIQVDDEDDHATVYHQHLLNLIDGCRSSDFKDTFHTSGLVESAFIVADSEFRGLEVALYSTSFVRENENVIASVLDQQEYDHVHLNRMVKKIASTSKRRTRYAKRLAYALAYGDAMVAHS